MRRRGRGHGNIFGDSEPRDSLPEFDEFIRMPAGRRGPSRHRGLRDASPRAFSSARRSVTRPAHSWVLGVRIAICSIVLMFGLTGMVVGLSQAVSGYADAGRMASAPNCDSASQAAASAACTVNVVLIAPGSVFHDGSDESIELDYPATEAGLSGDFVFVSYPGNAQFDAAIGDGAYQVAVRAEYWNGQIVTLTAGSQGITVTTDRNPGNQAGVGVGGALLSFALVLISVLMFIGIRPIRLRWLRPGVELKLFVSGSVVLSLGAFAAGVCLISQPARVALVAAIAPPITLGLTGLLWLALRPGRWSRTRRV